MQHNSFPNWVTWFPERISTSQDIEVYNQCAMKWFIQRCASWTKYTSSIDLEFGREFAKAMEITRKHFYVENGNAEESINAGLINIRDSFFANFDETKFPNAIKTPEKMMGLFRDYWREHPLEDSQGVNPFVMPDGTLSVEKTFDLQLPINHPITSKPLVLVCKPDLIGINGQNKFVLVDEKTSGQSGMNDYTKTVDKYRTSNQFVQYVTGINSLPEVFDCRITHVEIRRIVCTATAMKGGNTIETYQFTIDSWYQNEWWFTTLALIQDMVDSYMLYATMQAADDWNRFIPFRRSYGNCERFMKPCHLTAFCASGADQDLEAQGYMQIRYDSASKQELPLLAFVNKQMENLK